MKNEKLDQSYKPKSWEDTFSKSSFEKRSDPIQLDNRPCRKIFNSLIKQLSAKQEEVLKMVLKERLRPSEIADRVSRSKGSVVQLRDRAFQNLGKQLGNAAFGISVWDCDLLLYFDPNDALFMTLS